MVTPNEENLKELFEKFIEPEQAKQAEEDIQKGEQILWENPAPVPDKRLLAELKLEIDKVALQKRAYVSRRKVYRAIAVAAAVFIVTAISVKIFEKSSGEREKFTATPELAEAIWERSDIANDMDLAILTDEIEQIENEMLALQLGNENGNGDRVLVELEMKLIEINSDFWKG